MKKGNIFFILVLILSLWTAVYKIEFQPMFLWDESRQANNVIEMVESGNYLFTTYEGQPDFWNTKPHLLIVLQAISFKMLGPGLLALRLPSAMAVALMIALWFHFLWNLNKRLAPWIFVIVMLTCRGVLVYHIGRTGDYDALLMLFLSCAFIACYKLVVDGFSVSQARIFSLFIILAIFTKSLAALLWLPVFLVIILGFSKDRFIILRGLIKPAMVGVLALGAYYLTHEILTPGYLSAVWENEIVGRYASPNEGHVTQWYYYFVVLYTQYFEGFIFFLIVPLLLLLTKGQEAKNLHIIFVTLVLFLLIISISATRIHWYLGPAIPLLVVAIALSIDQIVLLHSKRRIMGFALTVALLFVSFWQQSVLWKENLSFGGVYPQYVLQQAEKTGKLPYAGIWLWENYNPLENYYSHIFRQRKISFRHTNKIQFQKGDTVYLYNYNFTDSLHKYYHCTQVNAPNNNVPMWVFAIEDKRSSHDKLK